MPAKATKKTVEPSEYLSSSQVRARFGGVSEMTLYRWPRKPGLNFPQPIIICGKNYWPREELVAWEREQAEMRNQIGRAEATNG